MDLPSQYREEEQVESIGKDLGDLQTWRIVPPYPMIRIEVGCDAPLILYRETETDSGEMFRINFDYVKLQTYCKRCFRMSHDTRGCPERLGRQHYKAESSHRGVVEDERKRPRSHKDKEVVRSKVARDTKYGRREDKAVGMAEPRPIRRDLMEELGEAAVMGEKKKDSKASTREWVKKSFTNGIADASSSRANQNMELPATENGGDRPEWMKPSVLDVDIARAIYAQEEKWDKAEAKLREPEEDRIPTGPMCQIPAVREANKAAGERQTRAQTEEAGKNSSGSVTARVTKPPSIPGGPAASGLKGGLGPLEPTRSKEERERFPRGLESTKGVVRPNVVKQSGPKTDAP